MDAAVDSSSSSTLTQYLIAFTELGHLSGTLCAWMDVPSITMLGTDHYHWTCFSSFIMDSLAINNNKGKIKTIVIMQKDSYFNCGLFFCVLALLSTVSSGLLCFWMVCRSPVALAIATSLFQMHRLCLESCR